MAWKDATVYMSRWELEHKQVEDANSPAVENSPNQWLNSAGSNNGFHVTGWG